MTRKMFAYATYLARWGAVLSLAVTVIGVLLPGPDLPEELPPDYLLHGIGFGVPAVLAAFSARNRRNASTTALIIALIAIASELAQHFVPGRTVSANDVGANLVGIVVGSGIGVLINSIVTGLVSITSRS